MKLKKLIGQAEDFVDSEKRSRKEKKKYLKQVLKKLSDHEKSLKKRMEHASGEEDRKALAKKLARTHAQRKKGIALLKDLQKEG